MRWESRRGGRSRLVYRGRLLEVRGIGVARKHGRTNGELVGDGRAVAGISCRRQFDGGLLVSGRWLLKCDPRGLTVNGASVMAHRISSIAPIAFLIT